MGSVNGVDVLAWLLLVVRKALYASVELCGAGLHAGSCLLPASSCLLPGWLHAGPGELSAQPTVDQSRAIKPLSVTCYSSNIFP